MRRTRMPALWAERREPPTASTCQPGRERVSATWVTMARTIAASTETERPWKVPSPMKSQTSEVAAESWISAAKVTTRMSNSARPKMKVTSVVRKARSLR